MKNFTRFLPFVLVIATLLISACGGTAATPTPNAGSGKVEPIPVAFIGTVDSMAGDQWVINGQTVTVAPDVFRDGPFNVGDQVKVEGVVNADGSLTVSRVEAPTPQDASTLPQFGDDNSNSSNSNDVNGNDANINDGNINDDNSANSNDDNGGGNTNDDNGNDSNSNDDNGNDSNSNDDNGGNDNSDDSNANDDNSNSGGDDDNDGDDDDNGGGEGNDNEDGDDDNGNGG